VARLSRRGRRDGRASPLIFALLLACAPAPRPAETDAPEDTDEIEPFAWSECERSVDVGVIGAPLDTKLAYAPSVLPDGDGWRMWYAVKGLEGATAIVHTRGADGVTWDEEPRVVLFPGMEGEHDRGGVGTPCVLAEPEGFVAYYDATGEQPAIMRCTSADGIGWGDCAVVLGPGNVPPYDESVLSAHVLHDGDVWRMYYVGLNGDTYRILYAESADGIVFSGHRLLFDLGAAGELDSSSAYNPFVMRDGDGYRMWYSGRAPLVIDGQEWLVKRLIMATSDDGLEWTGFEMAMDLGCEGTWDDARVDEPWVQPDGDGWRLWYDGFDDFLYEAGSRRILTSWAAR
jgi:hypothetical protein